MTRCYALPFDVFSEDHSAVLGALPRSNQLAFGLAPNHLHTA